MEKLLAVLGLMFAYYSIPEKRLIDMKIFLAWICLLVLMVSHFHSIYRLLTDSGLEMWIRVTALNLAGLGVPVLLGVAYVFKLCLRDVLERSA
jgi:small neutral amino acid transporter SnatA (MarC family)